MKRATIRRDAWQVSSESEGLDGADKERVQRRYTVSSSTSDAVCVLEHKLSYAAATHHVVKSGVSAVVILVMMICVGCSGGDTLESEEWDVADGEKSKDEVHTEEPTQEPFVTGEEPPPRQEPVPFGCEADERGESQGPEAPAEPLAGVIFYPAPTHAPVLPQPFFLPMDEGVSEEAHRLAIREAMGGEVCGVDGVLSADFSAPRGASLITEGLDEEALREFWGPFLYLEQTDYGFPGVIAVTHIEGVVTQGDIPELAIEEMETDVCRTLSLLGDCIIPKLGDFCAEVHTVGGEGQVRRENISTYNSVSATARADFEPPVAPFPWAVRTTLSLPNSLFQGEVSLSFVARVYAGWDSTLSLWPLLKSVDIAPGEENVYVEEIIGYGLTGGDGPFSFSVDPHRGWIALTDDPDIACVMPYCATYLSFAITTGEQGGPVCEPRVSMWGSVPIGVDVTY